MLSKIKPNTLYVTRERPPVKFQAVRVWFDEYPQYQADGWRFASGWFHSQGKFWAWYEKPL